MKKLTIAIIALLFFQLTAASQSCLPEGITFTTQSQIDNFQTNHPGCTEIEGDVIIEGGNDITNLNGLSVLTSIGYLEILYNPALTSLSGLDNVTSIRNWLIITGNDALTNLVGLHNVTFIGEDCMSSKEICHEN